MQSNVNVTNSHAYGVTLTRSDLQHIYILPLQTPKALGYFANPAEYLQGNKIVIYM